MRNEAMEQLDVDVHLLTAELADPTPLLDVGGEFLEGLRLPSSLQFESWLVVRHRLSATIEALLR